MNIQIMDTFTLSPSEFGFLYNECKKCYYNKYVKNILRPKYHMPSIFLSTDKYMTQFYDNKSTEIFQCDLDPGTISLGGVKVKSTPIILADYDITFYLSGIIDSLIAYDDGQIGVIDFKTVSNDYSKVNLYSPQLLSYAYCIEKNDPEYTEESKKVKTLGLICFRPNSFEQTGLLAQLNGTIEYQNVPKNHQILKTLLHGIAKLFRTPEHEIESNANCKYCK